MQLLIVSLLILLGLGILNPGFSEEQHQSGEWSSSLVGSYRLELSHLDSTAGSSSVSKAKRLHKALKRSKSRADFLASNQHRRRDHGAETTNLSSSIFPGEGEYMMKLELGTPPQSLLAMVDTGSDLVWINCNKDEAAVFLPNASSSYSTLPCNSTQCSSMSSSSSPKCGETCKYKYEYADGSRTSGDIAFETITLGNAKFPDFMLGCARKLKGGWDFTQGLIGLGRKSHSFVNQLGPKLGYRFSYCLVSYDSPSNVTSPLFLGSAAAVVPSFGIATTPIVQGEGLDETMYYVELRGISVGSVEVTAAPAEKLEELQNPATVLDLLVNKTVIDSGTTYSLFTPVVYEAVRSQMLEQVLLPIVDAVHSDAGLDLCFNRSEDMSYGFPSMTLHFANQADILLPFDNIFQVVSDSVVCLSMDTSGGDLSIIGNMQQQNFHIVYDLAKSQITFQPAQCDTL